MRIYSMTATFGKLENQTLKLEPGLNVIHAPNEWGKSTWCAFLLNMLYGIDTRERTKQDSVADKDRYAPWSGAAMSGRIDLNWDGRDITIERSSNQRVPLGNFRAYETATGMDIPELNATNCGQMLLGVERNVFVRAGFLKLADLPVTQDDALRRRLNNLVTTGDESDDADKLRQALRDLKNKCRSNRSNGLLPEAEDQRAQLKEQLWELQELSEQIQQQKEQKKALESRLAALENHKIALDYAAAERDARQVAEAQAAAKIARERMESLQEKVSTLPTKKEAQAACGEVSRLQAQTDMLLRQQQQLPEKPVAPVVPTWFAGMTPAQAIAAVSKDTEDSASLNAKQKATATTTLWVSILSVVAAIVALFGLTRNTSFSLIVGICGIVVALAGVVVLLVNGKEKKNARTKLEAIHNRYAGQSPDAWMDSAQRYASEMAAYESQLATYNDQTREYTQQQNAHQAALSAFTGDATLADRERFFEDALFLWQEFERAEHEVTQTRQHADALAAMAKTAAPPALPDTLTYSNEETDLLLARTKLELNQIGEAIAQAKGRMEVLGQPAAIQTKLEAVSRRIARLETYNAAIELAQDQLYKVSLVLQRRFSPRITKRTQELFSKLTGGRYQRITLGEDMGLQTASVDEVTLQELRRRSDGTIDQLYLALRLAVAGELTPKAPLILDDALVRFDDTRLALAMDILKEEAGEKQVILFTCHQRESSYMN